MANATAGTVTDLVVDSFVADPTGDNLDTGTAAVTIPYALSGKTDRVFFRVKPTNANGCTVTIPTGAYPPAFRSGIGDYVSATLAQNAIGWYGPFSSGRFVQSGANAGVINVKITPLAGDTIAAHVSCFRLPKV